MPTDQNERLMDCPRCHGDGGEQPGHFGAGCPRCDGKGWVRRPKVKADEAKTVTSEARQDDIPANACDASPHGRHEYAATGRERTGDPGEGYPTIGQFACKFCLTLRDVVVKQGSRRW